MNVNLDLLRTSPTTALTKSYLAEAALQLLHEQDAAIAAAVQAERERTNQAIDAGRTLQAALYERKGIASLTLDEENAIMTLNKLAAAIRSNGSAAK